jgi:hypothetical protein
MAVDLTTIFGPEIKVVAQPRQVHRQYAGFPGADGVTAMHMGSRGYQLVIRGRLRAATRPVLQAAIDAIEAYLCYGAADYSHDGVAYYLVVFDKFGLVTDSGGKAFHKVSTGWVTCEFIMYARALI